MAQTKQELLIQAEAALVAYREAEEVVQYVAMAYPNLPADKALALACARIEQKAMRVHGALRQLVPHAE